MRNFGTTSLIFNRTSSSQIFLGHSDEIGTQTQTLGLGSKNSGPAELKEQVL
jgi:hypothetical protein